MKTIFALSSVGSKTKCEKVSCLISDNKVISFRFSVSLKDIDTLVRDNNEILAYTFDEKKVTSLRKSILVEKKKLSKACHP